MNTTFKSRSLEELDRFQAEVARTSRYRDGALAARQAEEIANRPFAELAERVGEDPQVTVVQVRAKGPFSVNEADVLVATGDWGLEEDPVGQIALQDNGADGFWLILDDEASDSLLRALLHARNYRDARSGAVPAYRAVLAAARLAH